MENFRNFEAGPDPFGRTWKVTFRWLQTAISIRHSDSVDVKFLLESNGETDEKIISLGHPALLEVSKKLNRAITDPWVSRIAALHLKEVIETGEDSEKKLITCYQPDIERHAQQVAPAAAR